jgi:hypothetical protein
MELSTALRNVLADAIDSDLQTTGFARFYTSGLTTLLASCSLSNPAFGTAATGTITLSGTPQDTTPAAAGTAVRLGFYRNSTDTSGLYRFMLGIATGGAPDVTMANNVIATTDTVQISSLTITVPSGTPDVT